MVKSFPAPVAPGFLFGAVIVFSRRIYPTPLLYSRLGTLSIVIIPFWELFSYFYEEAYFMTICERMFETMSACGIRPAVVSKKLGVPANTLTNWAQRNTDPPAKYIIPICEVMGCSVEYLLTGQKTKKDPSPDISENGREMLELFERLPDREQVLLIGRLQEMVSPMLDSGKKGHASSGEQAV